MPALLWQAVPQASAYKEHVNGNPDAASALFAQHFAPNDADLAAQIFRWMWTNEAFSPAPKPVPWFCIENKPAVVFELRGSCEEVNAFALLDGKLQNAAGAFRVMAALEAFAK